MTIGLANLVAEIETRLIGTSPTAPLPSHESSVIPDGTTYVLALFDGLGTQQLQHRMAQPLLASLQGSIDAPYPSTTTVSMSTVATGLEPISHGTIGHQMWVPDVQAVVNVLKWMTPTGTAVDYPTTDWLPAPNLWERLTSAGVEAITIQPGNFINTPLTKSLYRGARLEPVFATDERIDATVQLAREPNRFIFVYFAEVDVSAHIGGQDSDLYREALRGASQVWDSLTARLPDHAVLIGTADHGHIDYSDKAKLLIRDQAYNALTFFGDPRVLMIKGDLDLATRLAGETGATIVDRAMLVSRLGSGDPHPDLEARLPDVTLDAAPGTLLLPRSFDRRLIGYHGGLLPAERRIPLLVG